ncbi:uncharacterized protein LOC115221465 [Argonauta hians]
MKMEGRQLSTAVSDLFLAASAYFVAISLKDLNVIAALGIFIQGMAASIGVFRFSMSKPYNDITRAHTLFSLIATMVGIPLLSVGFCLHYRFSVLSWIISSICFLAVTFSFFMDMPVIRSISEATASLALITIIVLSLYHNNMLALLGCIIFIFSGLVIGVDGSWFGIPRIDLLHYVLIFGNLAFYKSLT